MSTKTGKPDLSCTVEAQIQPLRLDVFLAQKLPQFSRSQLQKWMKKGHILLDGRKVAPAEKAVSGKTLEIYVPAEEVSLIPEQIPLDILFEDSRILVVNKPSGMVTHPAVGNFTGTLANAAAHHLKTEGLKSQVSSHKSEAKGLQNLRPGIVHGRDKAPPGAW